MSYIAPFKITNEILLLVSTVSEKIGSIKHSLNLDKSPQLRIQNRIRSVYSSCAIEANSLSLTQVKEIINGKTVIGPQKEIQEIKNAIQAYENIDKINPYSLNDLLKIHKMMSMYLIDQLGEFRNNEEGVFGKDVCIFIKTCPAINE